MRTVMALSRKGITVIYKCVRLRKCKDAYTDKCLLCKWSKAEMNGEDATKLLGGQ